MKTLLTAMAVLFTMATAATADHNVRLETCLAGATVIAIADQEGLAVSQVRTWLTTPNGAEFQHRIAANAEVMAKGIVQMRRAGAETTDVTEAVKTGKKVLDRALIECVVRFYNATPYNGH